ncbi:hypothetical protein MKW94_020608 [Papaver nudicaule]|uniref:WAT1-related protein n=1 Tax=Papaver nudicaule TaxID=74823 RepID=A0AA42AYZ7_PAPNU|nr:hypothetical protein [Papaver nudicaule]
MMKWLSEWQPAFLMVVIEFALATVNVLLKKVVDDGMDHLVLITYRTLFAAVFLAPMAYFWERKTRPKLTSRILRHLFISAMLGGTITQYGFLVGLQNTSATFTCAFINMVPVLTFLMAIPFGLEVVDIKSTSGSAKVLGTVVSVGGAMVLTLYKGMPITNISDSRETTSIHTTNHLNWLNPYNKSERWTIGTIALFAGSVFWSSWFLFQAKIGKMYPCQYSSTTIMSFFGAIQSALLSLATNQHYSSWVLKGKMQTITVLYSGIVGTGLSYVGMAYCVKKRGPVFTAAFSPLIQIIVATFDFSILHEQLHLGSVLGSILVIIGLYILLWGKSKEAKACVTKQVEAVEDHGEIDQATKV